MAYLITASILSVSFLLLTLATIFVIITFINNRPRFTPDTRFPKVSLLKPMMNVDDGLEENLASYYSLDYPSFEIVFGVEKMSDPCVPLLEKMRARYPAVPTKIVETGTVKPLNPKIDTLAKLAAAATGELYWVNDSNTRVGPQTLKNLAHACVVRGSKIVFSPVRGTGSSSFGSIMENSYMNLFVSGSIILASKLASRSIIMGKSMLIEKKALESIGGFERFLEYLAEDHMMGVVYSRHNIPISTNYVWVTNFNRLPRVKQFLARAARWSKLRFHIERLAYVLEILLNPIAIALIAALVFGGALWGLVAVAVIGRVFLEGLVFLFLGGRERTDARTLILFPAAMVIKDLLLFGVYLVPYFNSTVNWRGRRIRIGKESKIVSSSGSSAVAG